MLVTAMPIQSSSAMPMKRGVRPMSPKSARTAAAHPMLSSTVDSVSHTALTRRLPPRARSSPSAKEMYFPMRRTG